MRITSRFTHLDRTALQLCCTITWGTMLLGTLTACGGGGSGDAVQARAQSILVEAMPASVASGELSLKSNATSGLTVSYASLTPSVCTVDGASGMLTTKAGGRCAVRITQSGDERYAPAAPLLIEMAVITDQALSFKPVPALTLGAFTTVKAEVSSGLPVHYSSLTPDVCSVQADTGVVNGTLVGTCTVAADQAGDAYHRPAAQVTQNLTVTLPDGASVPAAPAGVTVRASNNAASVMVNAASVDGRGVPLLSYTVRSLPTGITATGTSLPLTVHCPSNCAGFAFTLSATNTWGEGAASASTDIITRYKVRTTFYEPDTQPRDSIFMGSFTLNATTGEVSDLRGDLSESMTGTASGAAPLYDMVQLTLAHQLSSLSSSALGGKLVTTFRHNHTSTFWTGTGGDGWTPEAGIKVGGVYHGFPVIANNPGNAYVRIFVNTTDPLAPLTQAQIDKLAYADCAPGGMMGATCMTGTSVAGYGMVGTMSGYPIEQIIAEAD